MKVHELKLNRGFFDDVQSGVKSFEIRKNDRDFEVDDILVLRKFSDGEYRANIDVPYIGNRNNYIMKAEEFEVPKDQADSIVARITYITDYEQQEGYVVMGIKVI